MEKLTINEILELINDYLLQWGDRTISLEEAKRYITGRESTEKDIIEIASSFYNTD
jgi:hypothetical protein